MHLSLLHVNLRQNRMCSHLLRLISSKNFIESRNARARWSPIWEGNHGKKRRNSASGLITAVLRTTIILVLSRKRRAPPLNTHFTLTSGPKTTFAVEVCIPNAGLLETMYAPDQPTHLCAVPVLDIPLLVDPAIAMAMPSSSQETAGIGGHCALHARPRCHIRPKLTYDRWSDYCRPLSPSS